MNTVSDPSRPTPGSKGTKACYADAMVHGVHRSTMGHIFLLKLAREWGPYRYGRTKP